MENSSWKIDSSVDGNKLVNYSKICSICLSSERDHSSGSVKANQLITSCLCTGKRSHQHRRCIEEWIEQTGSVSCPFCQFRYDYTKTVKGFWSYVKDCELEEEFMINMALFIFSLYLFIVGFSICQSTIDRYSIILFCFVCTGTVLLFLGIVSLIIEIVIRHYIRYSLWCDKKFKITIRETS